MYSVFVFDVIVVRVLVMLSNMFGLFGFVFCDVVICESFSVFGASLDELLCDFKWLLGGFEAFGW